MKKINDNKVLGFIQQLVMVCLLIGLALTGILFIGSGGANAAAVNQIPTGSIATVTSTPGGAYITVRIDLDQNFVNLRAGPVATSEKVGVLLIGQRAPVIGRSPAGEWYLIEYPGAPGGEAWVYAYLVNVSGGSIPIVELPPTPTPLVTPTINPTFAAQFIITVAPTRLPTFTPPPPLTIPTFENVNSSGLISSGVPMGMVIIGLAAFGTLLGLISLVQGR